MSLCIVSCNLWYLFSLFSHDCYMGEMANLKFPFDASSFLVQYFKNHTVLNVLVVLRETSCSLPSLSCPGLSGSVHPGCWEVMLTVPFLLYRDFHITSTSSASASATSSSLASFEHRGAHTAPAPGCEWREPRGLTQLHPEFPKRNFEESWNLWPQCS